MRISHIVRTIPIVLGCVALTVFARTAAAAGPDSTGSNAVIKEIRVTGDAGNPVLEITASKPVVYTFYRSQTLKRGVIDLSQTEPGAITSPLAVNTGGIGAVTVIKNDLGAGTLTRIEVEETKDLDLDVRPDPADKDKLLVSFLPVKESAKGVATGPTAEAKAGADSSSQAVAGVQQTAQAKTAEPPPSADDSKPADESPAQPSSAAPPASPGTAQPVGRQLQPVVPDFTGVVIKDIGAGRNGIEILLEGKLESYNSFKMSKPDRLVLDLMGVSGTATPRTVPINNFGIETARLGLHPDKVRIVFDAQNHLPDYRIAPIEGGVGVIIGQKAAKEVPKEAPAEKPEQKPAEEKQVRQSIKAPEPSLQPVPQPAPPVRTATPAPLPSVPAPVAAPKAEEAPAAPSAQAAAPRQRAAAAAAPATEAAAPPPAEPPAAPAKQQVASERSAPQPKGANAVTAINYKKLDKVSRIAVSVSGDCTAEAPARVADGILISLRNCQLPKKFQHPIDTTAFRDNILKITPYQVRGTAGMETKLRVKLREFNDVTVNRDGNTLNIDVARGELAELPAQPVEKRPAVEASPSREVAPRAVKSEEAADRRPAAVTLEPGGLSKKAYTGRRVTLEFTDADVRKIFQLLADVSNLNFLIGDDVTGTISIKLVNVPWDQALDVILENKGLGMKREGNIVQIKPISKMQSLADEAMAAKMASEKLMDLKTEIFDVNYASVSDAKTLLAGLKSSRDGASITQDTRTNRLIITDIQPVIDKMKYLLKNIDLPEKQVMIEARIVEATASFTRDLGVNWGIQYRDGSASVAGINTINSAFGGIVTPVPTAGSTPTAGGQAGISFGSLMSNIQLDLRLSAASTAGLIKIISTPKVATLNNKPAKISQGQSIPFQTTSADGTNTQFVEAALTLEVTPHINSDGTVIMKIKASNDTPGATVGTAGPQINKKEATTELLVKSGETTVIGGIYVDNDTTSDQGVPFLMDIPFIGQLFKSTSVNKTRTELLIFITPRILS